MGHAAATALCRRTSSFTQAFAVWLSGKSGAVNLLASTVVLVLLWGLSSPFVSGVQKRYEISSKALISGLDSLHNAMNH